MAEQEQCFFLFFKFHFLKSVQRRQAVIRIISSYVTYFLSTFESFFIQLT